MYFLQLSSARNRPKPTENGRKVMENGSFPPPGGPRAAGVGHRNGQLHGRAQRAREQAEDRLHTEEGARQQWGEDHQARRRHHLLQGGRGADLDAGRRVGFQLRAAVQERLALGILAFWTSKEPPNASK